VMAFQLGDIVLDFPPTADKYRVTHKIVRGREATSLTGAPLSLGVVTKKVWTLTFYPGEQYADICALFGTQTTFTDHDGTTYNVYVSGEASVLQYPIASIGLLTLTLREV